jgi:ATP-binding cassette, subfamily G (WHITE), member 2, SNQ2
VIDGGLEIYYGPRALARKYFEDLGFVCPPGANIADFLTSVTVPTERQIKPGFEKSVATTAEEFERIYLQSDIALLMKQDQIPPTDFTETTEIAKLAYHEKQPKHSSLLQSSYTIALHTQVKICIVRQMQIFSGDKKSMILLQMSALIQALVSGSLYYNLPTTSTGLFTRSGALFYPVIFFNLTAMGEVTASFMGRPILARHRDFSLYRPTAYVLARMITDIPLAIATSSIFSVVYYFMCGFQTDTKKFFIFWLLCIITTLVMGSTYRSIGSLFKKFNNASIVMGFWTMAMLVYAGYFIPYQKMHPWFKWIFWISPASYAYEAFMGNEFGGLILECVGKQLIPNGVAYSSDANRACAIVGASADGTYIDGATYILQSYSYRVENLWRNFGE